MVSSDKKDDHRTNLNEYLLDLTKALLEGKLEKSERFIEVFNLKASLDKETDRGCALMIGAYLDNLLTEFLSSLFVDDKSANENFLRADGPLGSFSSRIEMCYLLGQVSKIVYRELHMVRKIRNEFAHSANLIDFTEQNIHNRIRDLNCTGLPRDASPRHRIVRSSLFIAAKFHSMMWSERRLESPPDPNFETIDSIVTALTNEITK